MEFEDTHLSPLNNICTGYSRSTMLTLLSHLYAHYASILTTDLAENNRKLWENYNPEKPLKSLYINLNKCVDYATATVKPITKMKVVRINYDLVAETGKF